MVLSANPARPGMPPDTAAAPARPQAHSPLRPAHVGILGALFAIAPMSVDMYLPALPAIGAGFSAAQDEAQLSLSAFFFGFAIGQILWGPIGDWLGRWRPMLAGLALFTLASIGCALADGIVALSAWRFVQAVGACAAPVLARAMIRDSYAPDRAASVLSLMMLIMGAAPMLAPLVGGQLLLVFSWRAVFVALTAFGAALMLVLLRLPETLAPARRREARWGLVLDSYLQLLRSRRFLGYCLSGAFMYAGLFAYISGTPFVYIELFGVSPQSYGFLFGVNIIGMMVVSYVNSRVVTRFGVDRTLRVGCALAALFGTALLAVQLAADAGLPGVVVPLFFFLSMLGLIGANSVAGALAGFPHIAGAASALAGTLQFGSGAVSGWIVGRLADGTPLPMAATIAAAGLCCLAANLLMVPRKPA